MSVGHSRAIGRTAWLALVFASVVPGVLAADARARPTSPLEALVSGQRVEIKGRLRGHRFIDATRVRLKDAERSARIEGTVLGVDVGRRYVMIADFTVVLAADASIQGDDRRPRTLRDLRTGQIVEAKGKWSAGRLEASRVRVRKKPPAFYVADVEIEADIESAGGPRDEFSLVGHRIKLEEGGKIVDSRTPLETAGLVAPAADRLRRDVDDQQVPPIRIGDAISVGGRVGGDVWAQQSLVDRGETDERAERANASAQLLASVRLGSHVELYTKVGTSRTFALDGPDLSASQRADVRLYEAYVLLGARSPVGLTLGRQRFRDSREWFVDDYLDAVRMHVQGAGWRGEAAIAEGLFAGPNALRSRRDQRQAILSLTKNLGRRTEAGAFLMARDDRARRERPIWIGGEWNGRATSAVRYWTVGAVRRGEAASEALRGWAIDTGVAARVPVPGAFSFAAGYATATGDASGADGVDTRFRQTGLQDNQTRLFGVKRFARYGEVLDPELSNLTVLTFGIGARPLSRTSIDLVYHRYTQRDLRRSLGSNRLDAALTGRSTEIGEALDFILAIQQVRRISMSTVVGVFLPGGAVVSPARPVMYWKPEVRLYF
jgi:alginate production protein